MKNLKPINSFLLKHCLVVLGFVSLVSLLLVSCKTTGSGTSTTSETSTRTPDRNARKMLLRDEGLSQVAYVDLANPAKNWYIKVSAGRDLQLVGQGRVLIGTGNGYEEREISTGNKVSELTSFDGTVGARRLRNGNTLLTGLNWEGKQGIVLVEIDKSGTKKRIINFPQFPYVRLVRETAQNTFLIAADDIVFEGNDEGKILWQAKLVGRDKPHAWQVLRLANGQTLVSGGYTGNFQLFGSDGKLISTITGPADVHPNFFAGFQILNNGNYVVSNWQGHGPNYGSSGHQVIEYNPAGEKVWSWKQDQTKFSSLQGVIVLDGLNLYQMHIEDARGILVPVKR